MYSYTDFKNAVFDSIVETNIETAINVRTLLNTAARKVLNDLDITSTKRKAATDLSYVQGTYSYTAPTDLKGHAIIDIAPQTTRDRAFDLNLTTPEEFDRRKLSDQPLAAIQNDGATKTLLVSIAGEDADYDVYYYSNLPWQSAANVWKQDSTLDTDLLNADQDEFDLFVAKGKELAYRELRDWDALKALQASEDGYANLKRKYEFDHPSEARPLINQYYEV